MTPNALTPLPVPDSDSQPFWDALAEGRLTYQECANCGNRQIYFRSACKVCWSRQLNILDATGDGTIYSFTRLYQAGHHSFDDRLPYDIALVDLDEGPRVLADVETGGRSVAIGDRVTMNPRQVGDMNVLRFVLAERPEADSRPV